MIGGAVYYRLSEWLFGAARPGLCIGIAYAAAIALQYVFQLQWTVRPVLAVLIPSAFLSLFVCFRVKTETRMQPPGREKKNLSGLKILRAVFITVAMLVFINDYNTYIHHLQSITGYTEYNVYMWPRLVMIPGILLFGWISDAKNGKFLPISALCVGIVSLLNILLLGKETNLPNMCLYYISLTASVAYYHMTFLRLALLVYQDIPSYLEFTDQLDALSETVERLTEWGRLQKRLSGA